MKRLIMILCLLSAPLFGATIEVATEGDLQAMHNNPSSNFVLTADITCTTNFADYIIDTPSGSFYGDSHTISDFFCSNDVDRACFVESANAFVMNNITFTNMLIQSGIGAGLFFSIPNATNITVHGIVDGLGTGNLGLLSLGGVSGSSITGSRFIGIVTNGSGYIGGVLGDSRSFSGVFRDCEVIVAVYGAGEVGGFAGSLSAGDGEYYDITIRDSIIQHVSSGTHIGGFSADPDGTYSNCVVKNSSVRGVNGTGSNVGGFGGSTGGAIHNSCIVSNCTIYGDSVGGFLYGHGGGGDISGCRVIDCRLYPSGARAAGFIAYQDYGVFTHECSVEGGFIESDVRQSNLAGFIQWSRRGTTISNCFSTMSVGVTGPEPYDYIGGFVANSDTAADNFYNCYSTGAVRGRSYVGGFGGRVEGTVDNCFYGGTNVAGTASYLGIFIGWKNNTITDCGCATNLIAYDAIGSPAGGVEYEEADVSAFYDSSHAVYSTWDFATPIWYEWDDRLPRFTEQPADATATWRRRYMIR